MMCLPLGQMSHLESLRALCQGLYFLLYLSAIFPKLFILAKQLLFMQNTVNVLESPTLLVILLLQELDYLHQCILAFPYSESVEGWVLRMAFLLSLQTHATLALDFEKRKNLTKSQFLLKRTRKPPKRNLVL